MKVILYENRKIDPIIWDASTSEKRDKALLALFKVLDEEWECYCDMEEEELLSLQRAAWYQAAKDGDARAAEKLLIARRHYEYESWSEIIVI